MKSYQETINLLVEDYVYSRDDRNFYDHREWAEFVDKANTKMDMVAFIFGTTRKEVAADVIAAAEQI